MKKLNKTGPSTDPLGTPLVAGLQLDSAPLMTRMYYFCNILFSCTFDDLVPCSIPVIKTKI